MKKFLQGTSRFIATILTSPLALLFHITKSEEVFIFFGQLLSIIPGKIGSYFRVAYYCMTLDKCSPSGYIGFCTFFSHAKVELEENYCFGAFSVIGMAKISKNVGLGSHVSILSGKRQHEYEVGKSFLDSKGTYEQVSIGENCWVGNGCIIMCDVDDQTIVGAGSVVTKNNGKCVVIAGNPAKIIKRLD